jgi:hypothetical protein
MSKKTNTRTAKDEAETAATRADKKAGKKAAKKTAKSKKTAPKKAAAKKAAAKKPTGADAADVERFWAAVGSSTSRSEARSALLEAFPRDTHGLAGQTARRLTEFKSFAAAHDHLHNSGAVIASEEEGR